MPRFRARYCYAVRIVEGHWKVGDAVAFYPETAYAQAFAMAGILNREQANWDEHYEARLEWMGWSRH